MASNPKKCGLPREQKHSPSYLHSAWPSSRAAESQQNYVTLPKLNTANDHTFLPYEIPGPLKKSHNRT